MELLRSEAEGDAVRHGRVVGRGDRGVRGARPMRGKRGGKRAAAKRTEVEKLRLKESNIYK